jgi:hypothetical protein
MRIRILGIVALALAMLGCVQVASAAQLPSAITAAYLTPERGCRLELYRHPDQQSTLIDLQCLRWGDGLHTSMLVRVYTPGGQCPGPISVPFDPRNLFEAAKFEEARSGHEVQADASVLIYVDHQWRAMPKVKSGSVEYWSIRAFSPGALSVAVGLDQSALLNGGGIVQTWTLVESIASRAPYTCPGPAPPTPPIAANARNLICRVKPYAPSCGL